MIKRSTLALLATILAAGAASSAFAQMQDPYGVLPHHYAAGGLVWGSWGPQTPTPNRQIVDRTRPRGAYAYVPAPPTLRTPAHDAAYGTAFGFDPNSPALTGGGSIGYNSTLHSDW
jgi:hypothetical protein